MTIVRKYGVEIENTLSIGQAYNALVAAGVPCQNTDSHIGSSHSQVVVKRDGSVGGGSEVVLPPSMTHHLLKRVVSALVAAGGQVDGRCGLHVHVDATDMTTDQKIDTLAVLTHRYHRGKKAIANHFVSSERYRNKYCKSVRGQRAFLVSSKHKAVEHAWQTKTVFNPTHEKYLAIRRTSIGTIEFRQLQGTLDYNLITRWVDFCCWMVQTSFELSQARIGRGSQISDRQTNIWDVEGFLAHGNNVPEALIDVKNGIHALQYQWKRKRLYVTHPTLKLDPDTYTADPVAAWFRAITLETFARGE